MRQAPRYAVNDVVAFGQLVQQVWDLLRRVLQVVIQRDDDLVAGSAYAAEHGVVLAEVAHEADATHPAVAARYLLNDSPARVLAAVVDQHDFILAGEGGKHGLEP